MPQIPPAFGQSPDFDYKVRVSSRARRISLRVLPGRGLEVVLPQRADPACVPALLVRYRDWIDKTLRRLAPDPGADRALPDCLLLRGGLERLPLLRREDGGRGIVARETPPVPAAPDLAARMRGLAAAPGRVLLLPEKPPQVQLAMLREWLRAEARERFLPQLDELARRHGFVHAGARFRFQKSRWGSCSAKGAINLNVCLLFLPDSLSRYILLHELCHTRQMNHGDAFWKLVFAADPGALKKDRAMRGAWKYVPPCFLT